MANEFRGTDRYIATEELMAAVNAAMVLSRPLLIKGEPGTGKTLLANEIARALEKPFFEWHIKSTTKAQQGLYEYDAVSRLRDSQLGDPRVKDIRNYILKGNLWEAFDCEVQPVLLIDEIDKADIEFPNDLLRELDRMEFYVYETRETVRARHRPIIVITSNNEKELPDAFLRRCFFHYIRFPDTATMTQIVDVHFPDLKRELLHEALTTFFKIRETPGLKKKPTTSELLDWIKLLVTEDISARSAAQRRHEEAHSAAVRRAAEERAGRAPVRAARVPAPPECSLSSFSCCASRRAGLHHRIADAARGAQSGLGRLERRALLLSGAHLPGEGRELLRPLRPAFAAHFKGVEDVFAMLRAGAAGRLAGKIDGARFHRRREGPDRGPGRLGEADGDAASSVSRSRRSAIRAAASGSARRVPRRIGAYGFNPEGVRIGQAGGRNRSAVKVWDKREFANLDDKVELGTRNIKIALRRLRRFARRGVPDELALADTIDATARSGGWLDIKMQAERQNVIKMLLLLDIGGSMDDHVKTCEELFSAARSEFKHLEHYYFHNFVYEALWKDNRRRFNEHVGTTEIIRTYGHRLQADPGGRRDHESVRNHPRRRQRRALESPSREACGSSA